MPQHEEVGQDRIPHWYFGQHFGVSIARFLYLEPLKYSTILYHSKCRDIFEKRTTWETPISKANFEAGIRLERGLRNLIVSFLPPKLLKIVNFLGFKGIREVAFTELNAVAYELPGIYSLIGELIITMYWLYIEMHGCIGPANVDAMQKAVDKKIAQYPNVSSCTTKLTAN